MTETKAHSNTFYKVRNLLLYLGRTHSKYHVVNEQYEESIWGSELRVGTLIELRTRNCRDYMGVEHLNVESLSE